MVDAADIIRPKALDPPLAQPLDENGDKVQITSVEDIFPFTNPEFKGRIRHLKEVAESQEPTIKKIMSSIGNNMLGIRDDILHYVEVLKEHDGSNTYVDKFDPTNPDGTEKRKSFIPRSLRKELPVISSKIVSRDGRLRNTNTAIEAEKLEQEKHMTAIKRKWRRISKKLTSWN